MELDTIIDAFKGLNEAFEKQYYGLKGLSELYIKNQEKDQNKIEHMLDALLDSYEFIEDAKTSFDNLCEYLRTIDEEAADDYIELWDEIYLDEDIKTLEKKK